MQSIAYMVALSCFAVLTIFAIGLLILGKLNQYGFIAMLALTILVSAAIGYGAKKMWFKLSPGGGIEGGIETAKSAIDIHTENKVKEIDDIVRLHTESIRGLLKEVNDTSDRLSEHELSINDLVTQAVKVESDLQKTIVLARPPILQLKSFDSKKRGGGIGKLFVLVPDKNVALGMVVINAKIDDNYNSKIIQMDYAGGGMIQAGKATVTPDARQANKLFLPPVPIPIRIEIVVTEPCKVLIQGTYTIQPNIIEVDHPSE